MAGSDKNTQAEMGAVLNLMAHPMAGMAAASAMGVGFAAQFMGAWLGAVEGSLAASQRILSVVGKSEGTETPSASLQREARKATETLIAEARAKVVDLARHKRETTAREAQAQTAATPAKEAKSKTVRAVQAKRPASASARGAKAHATAKTAPVSPADDLKAIGGIGPKLEQALNAMGIRRYADLAALSKADIGRIEGQMGFPGRIARDNWVEQAGRLAAGQAKA